MKRTIQLAVIVIAAVVLIYSCNNNSVSPTTPTTTSLSGQLTNWNHTGKVYLYLVVIDSLGNKYTVDTGSISSSGSFSINLNTPTSAALRVLKGDTSCHPNITYTSGVLITDATFEVYDSTNTLLGDLFRSNRDSMGVVAGQFFVGYSYVNIAFSASGTSICPAYGDTVTYSVSGQAGWNKIVDLYQDVYSGTVTKVTVSNTEPSGGFWYVAGIAQPEQKATVFQRRSAKNSRLPLGN